MARGWFVVQVYTGYEKKVMNELIAKKNNTFLRDIIFDVCVPEEEYTVEKNKKKVVRKRNLYPGYVLVELDIPEDDTLWKKVYAEIKGISGVGMFLTGGEGKKPIPLSYDEVKSIFEKTGELKVDLAVLESDFSIGEKVKINEGPFKDFEGEVQEINTEKNSLVVRVEIFGRLTPVELEFNQVRKL
ncbi:MAG: transcription termination/antitermination protein NusG [Brevinematales bacterium]|nr:transcription termination/antitermination protein NusG [Brevinematales bacterium]